MNSVPNLYISVGSNINPGGNVYWAVSRLKNLYGPVRVSPVYRSAPVGFEGPDFFNCVIEGRSGNEPEVIVQQLKELESYAGRGIENRRGSRALDLDLLLLGERVSKRVGLILPRPDILSYPFVLRPIAELAPQRVHPTSGYTLAWHWAHAPSDWQTLIPVPMAL